MPTCDYQCDANDRILEVRYGMNEQVFNWDELCDRAGIEIGDTPADSPIRKLAAGGQVVKRASMGSGNTPPCGGGGGMCGRNQVRCFF